MSCAEERSWQKPILTKQNTIKKTRFEEIRVLAEGKALEDLSDKLNDDERSLWPFPEYARPVRAAHFDAFGRITANGEEKVRSQLHHESRQGLNISMMLLDCNIFHLSFSSASLTVPSA
eukprot:752278-Hanusia_phi.AAC.7